MSHVALVVEDERALSNAIKIKLEKNDFKVFNTTNATEAFELLEKHPEIEVIWLDHYLIGSESGLDLVVKIKQDEKYNKLPIFVVSNTAGGDKIKSYLQLGINKFYTKSDFRLEDIITDINNALRKKE
jgi:CheY-like chemotaxis protein